MCVFSKTSRQCRIAADHSHCAIAPFRRNDGLICAYISQITQRFEDSRHDRSISDLAAEGIGFAWLKRIEPTTCRMNQPRRSDLYPLHNCLRGLLLQPHPRIGLHPQSLPPHFMASVEKTLFPPIAVRVFLAGIPSITEVLSNEKLARARGGTVPITLVRPM